MPMWNDARVTESVVQVNKCAVQSIGILYYHSYLKRACMLYKLFSVVAGISNEGVLAGHYNYGKVCSV